MTPKPIAIHNPADIATKLKSSIAQVSDLRLELTTLGLDRDRHQPTSLQNKLIASACASLEAWIEIQKRKLDSLEDLCQKGGPISEITRAHERDSSDKELFIPLDNGSTLITPHNLIIPQNCIPLPSAPAELMVAPPVTQSEGASSTITGVAKQPLNLAHRLALVLCPPNRFGYNDTQSPCESPCLGCYRDSAVVVQELARVLRERHGGSSSVADWLDGVGAYSADSDVSTTAMPLNTNNPT